MALNMPNIRISVFVVFCIIVSVIAQYDYGDSGENESSAEKDDTHGFVEPLDFSPLFVGGQFGLSSAAPNQKVPKKYQSVFDVGSAESQIVLGGSNFFQSHSSDKDFSPESFGFIPVFSQGLTSATNVQPKRYQEKTVEIERTKATAKTSTINRKPVSYDIKTKHDAEYKKQHDQPSTGPPSAAYKDKSQKTDFYVPPTISDFQVISPSDSPSPTNDDHLIPYKKYSFQSTDIPPPQPTYQALASGIYQGYQYPYYSSLNVDPKLYRFKRYSGNRRKNSKNAKLRKAPKKKQEEDEDDEGDEYDPYDFYSAYKSRPKSFDEGPYSIPDFDSYDKAELKSDPEYGTDEEYNSREYDRIKSLSEQQAEEVKKNPENCKKVEKDSMTCMVCQNPKTGGSYESCSYVSEPKNNKYAYVKEQKYDSEDDPANKEESKTTENKEEPEKFQELKSTVSPTPLAVTESASSIPTRGPARYRGYRNNYNNNNNNNNNYDNNNQNNHNRQLRRRPQSAPQYNPYNEYDPQSPTTASSSPVKFEAYKILPQRQQQQRQQQRQQPDESDEEDDDEEDEEEEEKNSEEKGQESDEDYEYQSSIPNFFTDNEPKKNVEHVLAEFAKKDRSACKKVFKNEMTCYQCTDKNGLKNEECMFVSESAPKSSHLAYKEVKEFNSKPTPQTASSVAPVNSEEAESQIVTKPVPTFILPTVSSTFLPTEITTTKIRKNPPFKKYREIDDSIPKKSSVIKAGGHLLSQSATLLPVIPTIATRSPDILKRNARSSRRTRSNKKNPTEAPKLLDDIADPDEFAGDESKGAFWAETVPRFSRALGVSLPTYMLTKSEHEDFIDEFIASG